MRYKALLVLLAIFIIATISSALPEPDEFFISAKEVKIGYRKDSRDHFKGIKRQGNYIFEGEAIYAEVFVRNPDGIENLEYVAVTIGAVPGIGNDIEAICMPDFKSRKRFSKQIRFNKKTDRWYDCEFIIEPSLQGTGMYGEYYINFEAKTTNGEYAVDETLFGTSYFINPIIAVAVEGDLYFEDVEPGNTYSVELLVTNDVELGADVPLEFFVSGTNVYDTAPGFTQCPISNTLSINQFSVKAEYDGKKTDFQKIPYSFIFPRKKGLIKDFSVDPHTTMTLIIELEMPETCSGEFDQGQIYIWARPADRSRYAKQIIVGIELGIDIEFA